MKLIETDADFAADGSLKLLTSPRDWWKAGRQHVVVVIAETPVATDIPLMEYLLSTEGEVLPEVELGIARSRIVENRMAELYASGD